MKILVTLLLLMSIQLLADDSICFDKHQSFSSSAPKGWVADFQKGKALGTCVVYYLKGTTFDSSPAKSDPPSFEHNYY